MNTWNQRDGRVALAAPSLQFWAWCPLYSGCLNIYLKRKGKTFRAARLFWQLCTEKSTKSQLIRGERYIHSSLAQPTPFASQDIQGLAVLRLPETMPLCGCLSGPLGLGRGWQLSFFRPSVQERGSAGASPPLVFHAWVVAGWLGPACTAP